MYLGVDDPVPLRDPWLRISSQNHHLPAKLFIEAVNGRSFASDRLWTNHKSFWPKIHFTILKLQNDARSSIVRHVAGFDINR